MSNTLPHELLTLQLDCVFRDIRVTDLPELEWFGEYSHFRRLEESNYRDVKMGLKRWLIAEVNGFPIGHIKINLHVSDQERGNPRGYLFALRIIKPFQGLGIGSHLIKIAEALLRADGYRFVSIAVGMDNPRARRLYEKLGYQVYREELGRWSYTDPAGITHDVQEPEFLMDKPI